jgi:putative Ca2+/H+ antiporter (TMEM165/GDT1 family)
MNLAIVATCFAVIFVAELPDKTALASLMLGTRYRAGFVFAGVAAAFAVHVLLAVSAGSLLFLLPHRVMQAVVAVLFAAGAVLMLRRRDEDAAPAGGDDLADGDGLADGQDREPDDGPAAADPGSGGVATLVRPAVRVRDGFWRVAVRSFAVLFVAEFGDLTQLATANLAARYHDPVAVGVGAVLGLWAVGALAITGGRQLLRIVPFRWITRIAAAVMTVLAVISLVTAISG